MLEKNECWLVSLQKVVGRINVSRWLGIKRMFFPSIIHFHDYEQDTFIIVHKHLENDRMKNDQLFMFIKLTFHMNF